MPFPLPALMIAAIACRGAGRAGDSAAIAATCSTGLALVERWLVADTAGAWNGRQGVSMPWSIADIVNEEAGGDAFAIAIPGRPICSVLTADSVSIAIPWQVIGEESAPDGKQVVFEEGVRKDTTVLLIGRGSGRWLIHGWSRLARPSPGAALDMWTFPPAQRARIRALADSVRARGA